MIVQKGKRNAMTQRERERGFRIDRENWVRNLVWNGFYKRE